MVGLFVGVICRDGVGWLLRLCVENLGLCFNSRFSLNSSFKIDELVQNMFMQLVLKVFKAFHLFRKMF